MPLKNIELRHGSKADDFTWRIVIPSNKKEAYRPKLCWVDKKPFVIGETLYFLVIPEYFLKSERIYLSSSRYYLIKVARKYSWFSEDDIFSFIYEGTDIRHFI
ncbi:hypothetical protein [Mogibacterium diversum]|mgnify:FL=1|uniref:hypothetical protein n=1 Tax=Mogibacterium diversum TaxID=114527 RepID=UPI0026EB268C|nr:hypothetical protein [Mogibacterium diversum]